MRDKPHNNPQPRATVLPKNILRILCPVLLMFLLLASGCGEKTIVITNYPSFYQGKIKTIAVAPFRNATGVRNAGNIISDTLAGRIAANGTYKVYNRNDLLVLQNERDLRTELGLDNAAIAAKFRNVGKVQAVLVGTVTNFSATQQNDKRFERIPIQAYNPRTRQMYISGYRSRNYTFTKNEGNVAVTATLIRVSDGLPLFATPTAISDRRFAQGSPPTADRFACRSAAASQVVAKLVRIFCVTRQTITVKESRDFRTASSLYDNKWDFTDSFKSTDAQGYLVLRLPASCDRNRFRITIIRKGTRESLFEHKFVWTKKFGGFGYGFKPSKIVEKAGGPGEFVAKFYSGPEPVMQHKFRIR